MIPISIRLVNLQSNTQQLLQQTDTAAGGKRYTPKIRWRRKVSSVANHATAGTGNKRGQSTAAAAAPSSGAGDAGATPNWIQGLGGE